MIGDHKIVWFDRYCPSCVHRDEHETSEACSACLEEPARIDSHRPEKYDRDPNFKDPDYTSIKKLESFLYEIEYSTLDYIYAKNYFKTHEPFSHQFGCSCVRKGELYGRNYDWYYDNYPSFVVHVPAINGRHATMSVCQGFKDLTERFVDSKADNDLYKVLPFIVLDGINDAGVVCNVNVVPAGDWGSTTGTTPTVQLREELSIMMLNRYILDNFGSAEEAVNMLIRYCSVYSYEGFEAHFMIADLSKTYILEFLNNQMQIIDVTNERPYMTNFYIKNSAFNSNTGKVDRHSLTPHGSGVERYELIASKYDSIENVYDMAELMHYDLKYTNSYDEKTNPFWYTELVGNYEHFGDLTVLSPESAFQGIKEYTLNLFKNRSRDISDTWQTVHTVVYNIVDKMMYIIPQEREFAMHKIKMRRNTNG